MQGQRGMTVSVSVSLAQASADTIMYPDITSLWPGAGEVTANVLTWAVRQATAKAEAALACCAIVAQARVFTMDAVAKLTPPRVQVPTGVDEHLIPRPDIILFPCCLEEHWSLLVVCHPGMLQSLWPLKQSILPRCSTCRMQASWSVVCPGSMVGGCTLGVAPSSQRAIPLCCMWTARAPPPGAIVCLRWHATCLQRRLPCPSMMSGGPCIATRWVPSLTTVVCTAPHPLTGLRATIDGAQHMYNAALALRMPCMIAGRLCR